MVCLINAPGPDGETGRHRALKMPRRTVCKFESCSGYHCNAQMVKSVDTADSKSVSERSGSSSLPLGTTLLLPGLQLNRQSRFSQWFLHLLSATVAQLVRASDS